MDDHPPAPASGHPLQGPHKDLGQDLPLGFIPLRLLLLPGGLPIELTRPDMLVGRHSDADIRLALPDVSRRHCRFVFQHGQWKVIDLNSLNGVFVNDERMQEATLYNGDEVRLGGFTFAVRLQVSQPAAVHGQNGILQSIAAEIDQRKAS
jgi:pSer/pThr/pTyr-binding forkhead associated (FHA) protein